MASLALAEEKAIKPTPKDKCPVCGMNAAIQIFCETCSKMNLFGFWMGQRYV
jgi:hypothetical protein